MNAVHGPVVVTGAGGFIGRALCRELDARGVAYRALVRSQHAPRAAYGDERIVSALESMAADELDALVEGACAIVHLAGRAHVLRDTADDPASAYRAANVEATRKLASAAGRMGVPRFVLASTVKVHGETSARGHPLTADAPIAPADAYGVSKAEAESVLRDACVGSRTTPLILRLPLVYGPGVRGNLLALLDAIAAAKPIPVGAIDNRRSIVNVRNVADAIARALESAAPLTGAHFVADARSVSTPELVRAIAHALGEPVRMWRVPVPLLRAAGAVSGRGGQVARLTDTLEVHTSSFERASGWTARYGLEEGLEATARWWRTRHSI